MSKEESRHAVGDEARFRLAMTSSGIGMAIADLEGRWLDVNPAFDRMFGYASGDALGRHIDDALHADDRAMAQGFLDGLLDGSVPAVDAERRYLRTDGSTLWAHLNVAAMCDADARPIYLVAQLRDVGTLRKAEMALRETNASLEARVADGAELQAAMIRQAELFAYGVSHDLRSPLRAIDSFAALLANHSGEALDPTGRDYLERIRAAAGRMARLIDALLQLSRASRVSMQSEPVDLSLLADWSSSELRDADRERAATISVQPGLYALGDERQLKLLFDHLLSNAWKFSSDDQPIEIEVTGERVGDRIVLAFRDRGIGFDMRYSDKLFEPFQRLHGPEQAGGNGIGLAIAHRVVERHGGRLWAQSEAGVGSTFHVELPAVPDPET